MGGMQKSSSSRSWEIGGRRDSEELQHYCRQENLCVSNELFERRDNVATILIAITTTGNTNAGERLYRISRSNCPRKARRPILVVDLDRLDGEL